MSATPKLTDDDVREILLTTEATSHSELARRFKVNPQTISRIRRRMERRAVIMAATLGLLPMSPQRECWAAKSKVAVVASDRFIRARVAGERPA